MGKYPNGLAHKYAELVKQMRAPPGTDLTKLKFPLMLKDRVKPRGSDIEPRTCTSQLNVVFHCLSSYEFDQSKCTKESEALMKCFNESVKDMERKKADSRGELKGGQTSMGKNTKLTGKQVNALLQKAPHPFPDGLKGPGNKYRR